MSVSAMTAFLACLPLCALLSPSFVEPSNGCDSPCPLCESVPLYPRPCPYLAVGMGLFLPCSRPRVALEARTLQPGRPQLPNPIMLFSIGQNLVRVVGGSLSPFTRPLDRSRFVRCDRQRDSLAPCTMAAQLLPSAQSAAPYVVSFLIRHDPRIGSHPGVHISSTHSTLPCLASCPSSQRATTLRQNGLLTRRVPRAGNFHSSGRTIRDPRS